jgi:hypothetical protein
MARPLHNAEGEEAMPTGNSSSSEDNKEAHYYPADVEAAAPLSDGQESEDGHGRFYRMRHSRGAVFAKDMFLILLLLGWWIPGILRKVSLFRDFGMSTVVDGVVGDSTLLGRDYHLDLVFHPLDLGESPSR